MSDILVNKEGDLEIQNGDFVTGDPQQQDIQHILLAEKGQFRQFPTLGVGVRKRLNGPFSVEELRRDVRINLESDGFKVNKVDTDEDGNIQVDAEK